MSIHARRGPLSPKQWRQMQDSSSRAWGPGQTPGDGSSAGRGSAGEQPRPDRIGSARVVIGMAALNLAILCVVLAFIAGAANGLLVLATIFAVVYAWAAGAFSRGFWSR